MYVKKQIYKFDHMFNIFIGFETRLLLISSIEKKHKVRSKTEISLNSNKQFFQRFFKIIAEKN